MKYYLIAGEASGDLHGSNLMRGILEKDSSAEFRLVGGDQMQVLAPDSVFKHIQEMSFMGFVEVLMNLRSIQRNLREVKQDIIDYAPDAVILIDFPGFNLRIASFCKEHGIAVHYYIAPKVWAWNTKRVFKIKKNVDYVYSILPFEVDFFKKYEVEVNYVGNPLMDALDSHHADENFRASLPSDKPVLAILPGSRKMELDHILPTMLLAAKDFDQYQVVIAGAANLPASYYEKFNLVGIPIVFSKTYDLLKVAEMAMVTSGTATLETALMNVPQVVCYRGNSISVMIARMLVKIKFISLVNLIMDAPVVVELIQDDCNAARLSQELRKISRSGSNRSKMLQQYGQLRAIVAGPGASARAASLMVQRISR